MSDLAFSVISFSLLTDPTTPTNSKKLGVMMSAPLYFEKLFPFGSTNIVFLNLFAFLINEGIS